jgi:uncharacterized protein YcgI (DUF1989 family)
MHRVRSHRLLRDGLVGGRPALRTAGRNSQWPCAGAVFARTRIGEGGDLVDDPVATTQGTRIELRTKFDVVVAVMAAGTVSPAIGVVVNPACSEKRCADFVSER